AGVALAGSSVNSDRQLEVAPQSVLEHVFPPTVKTAELTLCLHAQLTASRLAAQEAPARGASSAKHAQKAVRKESRRDKTRPVFSDSTSTDDKYFDAAARLSSYGLPNVSHEHVPPHAALRTVAAKARKAVRRKRPFVVNGSAAKWAPQWMGDRHKPQRNVDITHAQWTALWWSRALSQLTVQAHSGAEAVSVQALLTELLDANGLAVQESGRVAAECDRPLWDGMSERTLRKDKSCAPEAIHMAINENRLSRAREAAKHAVEARRQQQQPRGAAPSVMGAGKGAHKQQGGPPLSDLKQRCAEINARTLGRAQRRASAADHGQTIVAEIWAQTAQDVDEGRAGPPVPLDRVDLNNVLLVDTFGIWGQHGDAASPKVRSIRNSRTNGVNEYAFMPQKLRHDDLHQMVAALRLLSEGHGDAAPAMGKADFKSAFKTLPPDSQHEWPCWALVSQPDTGAWMAAPLWTHVFGNLGSQTHEAGLGL
ncbi:unnamed protein product, partial [Prorocentrum cordatum]